MTTTSKQFDSHDMGPIFIQNGEVVLPDRSIPGGTVVVAEGLISHAGPARNTPRGAVEVDARGGYVTPGLIDLHIHGAGLVGWEMCSAEGLEALQATLLAHGIVRFVPTMMADEQVVQRVADLLENASCSERVPGIYLEGPFISPEKRGGIQPRYVRPVDVRYLHKLQRIASHRIRMMTFAPELDGAESLPPAMRQLGILPCVGHSQATASQAAGVCGRHKVCCTHLYNAMSGLDHREPGLAAFALNRHRVYAELNPDGTHVAPELLRITRKAKSTNRIVLISDAVVSAGAAPGVYDYMNRKVRSSERGVYYVDGGTLVGSSILLNQGVKRFMKFTGAAVHEAVRMASLNPAHLLGLARKTGSLEPGKSAEVVVFSRSFAKVHAVFWRGKPLIG
ncbi:MAG: N-acetylglucosamine-6-phosphate deacetylase [Planctomycetota bacterium]